MTRPRPHERARGDDAELWQQLGTIGGRLAPTRPAGFATRVRDKWLALDGCRTLPPGDRIDALVAYVVGCGVPASEVHSLVERWSARASQPGAAEARQRSAERRARLTAG